MLRRIYRQRRRLLLGGFFFALGAMMVILHSFVAGVLPHYPKWIIVLTVVLITVIIWLLYALCSALFVSLFPDWRTLVEMVGLIFFINTALYYTIPSVFALPYVDAAMPFILTFALFSLVYGEVLDRFHLWVDHNSSRSFLSPKSAETLWAELIPGEGPINSHWDTMLYSLERDDEDPDSLYAQYNHGGSFYEHQTMTFLDYEAPYYARYHHVGEVDPKNKCLVEGTHAVRIRPLKAGGCEVIITDTHRLMRHSCALMNWFDDYLGDQTDHISALHLDHSDWSLTGRTRRKINKIA